MLTSRLLSLLLFSGLSFVSLADNGQACAIRMSVESDFPPHLIQQNSQWTGLSVELMQRLAQEVDCQLEFVHSPWLRSLQLSEDGKLDVLTHLSYTEQRKAQFAFIGPHHLESIYLVGDPTEIPATLNLVQLAKDTDLGAIAVLHGAYYGEEFARLSQQPGLSRQLVTISSIQDKLALLRAGRITAILEDISVLHYWQQHQYPDADKYQPLFKVYESKVYFGFSKASLSAEQISALAQAWQRLYQQGKLARVYEKYQITNYGDLTPEPIL
ncbi:transporter substrate-binding domain-containing protein [Rheinheimera baltica]|uniref:Transporter substrate-binding domain-containing protein n=1 Tax=Rheinheimera baltica TaxID=67576 RepID=A0ABT9HVZ3_9GAMM|nr:transporter substrate-binding domain-containing protein [Rheinheimera baltica]MDP5135298.1 transporter substrate-binding domain-containing protein [Rheinheimera baltica]